MSKTEKVIFYHWLDQSPQSTPSGVKGIPGNMTVQVSPGEIGLSVSGHRAMLSHPKEVRFLKGRLETSDPDVIRTIRKLMADGERCITESEDEYLDHVQKPSDRAKAKTAVVAGLRETNATLAKESAEKDREIERLKEKLARENEELQKMLDKGKSE
ncbi:MAG TPA: hypothetical protein VKJ45_16975 [Blastocatellia bacterium]|nr:hypothetical protein [Blastocatellia bacterium]